MKPGTTGLGSVNSSGLRFRGEEVQTRTCAWENWTSGDVHWLTWNISVCLSVCIYAACMHVRAYVRTYLIYIYHYIIYIIYCIIFIDLSILSKSIHVYPYLDEYLYLSMCMSIYSIQYTCVCVCVCLWPPQNDHPRSASRAPWPAASRTPGSILGKHTEKNIENIFW